MFEESLGTQEKTPGDLLSFMQQSCDSRRMNCCTMCVRFTASFNNRSRVAMVIWWEDCRYKLKVRSQLSASWLLQENRSVPHVKIIQTQWRIRGGGGTGVNPSPLRGFFGLVSIWNSRGTWTLTPPPPPPRRIPRSAPETLERCLIAQISICVSNRLSLYSRYIC